MSLKKSDIRAVLKNENATDEEKIGEILDLLHGETDTLKAQIDEAKNSDTSKAKEWKIKPKSGKASTLPNTQHFRTIRRSRKRHRRQQRKKTRTRNC